MKNIKPRQWGIALFILALTLTLAACGNQTPTPPRQRPTSPKATELPASPTPAATNTPTQPSIVLLAAADARPGVKKAAQTWAQSLANKLGYAFTALSPKTKLPPNATLIITVGTAPHAAQGRVIAVNPPKGGKVKGAQVLHTASADVLHRAFLAGYLAAVVTKDWRVGIVADASEDKIVAAFKDGVRYYCGLCRPLHPPFFAYPQFALVPAGAKQGGWAAAAQELVGIGKVHTLALSPLALQNGLQSQDLHADLIAIPQTGATAQGDFAASVEANISAGLDLLWKNPKMQTASAPMKIRVLAADFVSPGRLRWVMETQKALAAGLIAP